MGAEQVAMSAVAAIGARPRLSQALFGATKWGNPFGEERFSYPYPMYDRMREGGPVAYGRPYRQWFVFGYEEVQHVLRSSDTATSPVARLLLSTNRYRKLSPTARTNFARWLLVIDPPDHTRLRSAVSRAFTPKQVAAYEPLVEKVTAELLADLPSSGSVDIAARFTTRLPIQVICEMLGLPLDRRDWLFDASREIGGMLEPLTTFDPVSMSERFSELERFFTAIVQERRRQPTDDLISALATANDSVALGDDEVIAMIAFLLFAGHETVAGALGTALVALARFPKQRDLLRRHPEMIDNAVEELLRFDSPVQVSGRQATADIAIDGQTIRAGDNIGLMIGAANRDARRWSNADELRLDRVDPKPISFGFGAHHCLGAALARMQIRAAIPPLLDRLGDYAVDLDNTTWKRSFALRGPVVLPVTIGRG
jgi:cytochrome P450